MLCNSRTQNYVFNCGHLLQHYTFKERIVMKKIVAIFAVVTMQVTCLYSAQQLKKIPTPAGYQKLINKKKMLSKLSKAQIQNQIKVIEQNIKELDMSARKILTLKAQRDLGIVSRGLDNNKKEALASIAKKPIKGFNANDTFTQLQKKLNQTYVKLNSLTPQQQATEIADISNSLLKFLDTIKSRIHSNILIRLSNLQSTLYVLAEEAKKMPTDIQQANIQAIKQIVGHLRQDIRYLDTLGLHKEALDIKTKLNSLKDDQDIDLEQLKTAAKILFTQTQQLYNKVLSK